MSITSVETISKRDAARAEIEGAITLLALRSNYLGAELLSQAANEILLGVAKKHDIHTFNRAFYEDYIKPEHIGEAKQLMRQTYNFLKHADRDAGTTIDRYNPEVTIWNIFTASLDYRACFGQMTLSMLIYHAWFISRNPNFLKEDTKQIILDFEQQYGSMAILSRKQAISSLKGMYVDFAENESALLSSPQFVNLDNIEMTSAR